MADKNLITRWLLKNKALFKLSYTQYDWPERFCPSVIDFSASLEFSGNKCIGRGIDLDAELAVEKASAEAVERYICKKIGIPSVGVAVSGATSSLQHATCEALERYYLNQHINSQIPFRKTSEKEIHSTGWTELISLFIRLNHESQVDFYQMQTSDKEIGIVCHLYETKFEPFSFGFSLADSFDKAIEKSFLEALPNFAAQKESLISKPGCSTSILSEKEKLWHLNSDFLARMIPLMNRAANNSPMNLAIEKPQLEITPIKIVSLPEELSDCPIEPIRVKVVNTGGKA